MIQPDDRPSSSGSPAGEESRLLNLIAAALRTSLIYEAGNEAMLATVQRVCDILVPRLEDREQCAVNIYSRCFFVDGKRIRLSAPNFRRLEYLMALFDAWSLSSIEFHEGIEPRELAQALKIIATEPGPDAVALAERLSHAGIQHVGLSAAKDEEPLTAEHAKTAIASYASCIDAVSDFSEEIEGEGGAAGLRRLRHVTQSVVDRVLRDPASMISLTTLREYDTYLLVHSTNVAILSVIMGQRLGLTKSRLGELCLSAFLHDIGKVQIDPEIVRKEGPLTDDEWLTMRSHPLLSADVLLSRSSISATIMQAVTVSFEHHINFDGSGYPPHPHTTSLGLPARVVTIADRYDAMTTPRPYRAHNITPAEALHHMILLSGSHYDPLLLKLFVDMMGAYPVGTVVVLDSGETVVVQRPPLPAEPVDRPVVRVLEGPEPSAVYNLAERDDAGAFIRNVVHILNPGNQGLLPAIDPQLLTLD